MNDQEIATAIGLCSQWWPNWKAPESVAVMIKSWRPLLVDVDFDAGLAALSEYSTAGHAFPPPVGVLRRLAAQLVMPGGQAPTVDEAWGEVLAAIGRVGRLTEYPGGPKLSFSHPAIVAVVDSLGWLRLCDSDNQIADRARFAQFYAERVEREVSRFAQAPNVLETRARLAAGRGEPRAIGEMLADALPTGEVEADG